MSTKNDGRHRRSGQLNDITDVVEMLLPGNRNQQHAAARLLLELKWADGIVANFSQLQRKFEIPRMILRRTRAKLSHLGLIEQ